MLPIATTCSILGRGVADVVMVLQVSSRSVVNKMTPENLAATVGVNLLRKSEVVEGKRERERHDCVQRPYEGWRSDRD